MGTIQVGAQLYTVREFTQTPEGIEATLRRIREMGYRVIQISKFGPIDPQRLASVVQELDLTVCVTHTPFERLTGELDEVIREHKLLGCPVVGLGAMPQQYRDSLEGFEAFIRIANGIAERVYEQGLKFGYHNHKFEFERFGGRLGMDLIFEETDPEKFEFILDTYWLQAGGVNPTDYVKKAAGRMSVCHFKDMAIRKNEQIFAEIGRGNIDFGPIYAACEETGVPYIVIEQDRCDGDPFESLKISLDYMTRTFG